MSASGDSLPVDFDDVVGAARVLEGVAHRTPVLTLSYYEFSIQHTSIIEASVANMNVEQKYQTNRENTNVQETQDSHIYESTYIMMAGSFFFR